MENRTRQVRRGVPVLDRKILKRVIEAQMVGRWKTQTAMARRLGVSQGYLNDLLQEKGRPRITRRVLARIRDGLPTSAWEELAKAVVPPEFDEIFATYTAWLGRQLARFNLTHMAYGNHPFWDHKDYERWPERRLFSEEGAARQEACARLYETLRREGHTSLLMGFVGRLRREHPEEDGWSLVDGKRRVSPPTPVPACATLHDLCRGLTARATLAVYRVLEPLADGERFSGGVELTWYELQSVNHLAAYFKAAETREQILLRRDNDITRAQELAILLMGGMEYSEFAHTMRRLGRGDLPPMDGED